MADKRAIIVVAPELDITAKGEVLDKFNKKAVKLPRANTAGLGEKAKKLGAVETTAQDLAKTLETAPLALITGAEDALQAALDAANRRTVIVLAGKNGAAFHGMSINSKAGEVNRQADADDIALTTATLVDVPIGDDCEARVLYQVFKDPNLKLNEIIKLQEAIARMESVLERNNREPWDKHDCA